MVALGCCTLFVSLHVLLVKVVIRVNRSLSSCSCMNIGGICLSWGTQGLAFAGYCLYPYMVGPTWLVHVVCSLTGASGHGLYLLCRSLLSCSCRVTLLWIPQVFSSLLEHLGKPKMKWSGVPHVPAHWDEGLIEVSELIITLDATQEAWSCQPPPKTTDPPSGQYRSDQLHVISAQ